MSTLAKITVDRPVDDIVMWPYVNQIEELLDAVNSHLVCYLEEKAAENPEAGQYLNSAHILLGAVQTVAAALAVRVHVRGVL